MAYTKVSGIAIEMVRMSKTGRLTQYVEPMSEAFQLLEANGWKAQDGTVTLAELEVM